MANELKETKQVPISIWDLDKSHFDLKTANTMDSFEHESDVRFHAFSDASYRKRRHEITQYAFKHKHGECIPRIEYNEDESANWKHIYLLLKEQQKLHACKEHLEAMDVLEKEGIYSPDFIPQIEDVSRFFQKKVGFRLRPVGGQISIRDYLEILAFRTIPCTQYMRHPKSPHFSPEPDMVHELLGHLPIMLVRECADLFHQVAVLSLGLSDENIARVFTMIWWTFEWGLCYEGDQVKAWGGAILSAYGELENAFSGVVEFRNLKDVKNKEMPVFTFDDPQFQDETFQKVFYISSNLLKGQRQLVEYVERLQGPVKYRYEPVIQSLERVDNEETRRKLKKEIFSNLELLVD